jgi:hypothetical protein
MVEGPVINCVLPSPAPLAASLVPTETVFVRVKYIPIKIIMMPQKIIENEPLRIVNSEVSHTKTAHLHIKKALTFL